MRFADKVCLATGGGSGIGQATCNRFTAEGGRVAVVDNNEQNGSETARMIVASEGQALFVRADVSRSSDVQAAIMTLKPVVDLGDEEWDRVLDVNLRAVFLFCKYCLPHMARGAIVNVSSVHADKTEANVMLYAAWRRLRTH